MDKELWLERERFKKRAMAQPVVEKRKAKPEDRPSKKQRPPQKSASSSSSASAFNYKTMAGSSQYKFGILAKIIKHMKQRHCDNDMYPLTVDEILDETNQLDIGPKNKHWLNTEALPNNPKIEVVEGDKYRYKPKYNIRDSKGLRKLLDKNDQRGLGGVLQDDIEESLPRAAKCMRILGDQVIYVTRPNDKKRIMFYNDKAYNFTVDEELQKLWRSVAIEGVDDTKIEEYLEKHGITSMADQGLRKVVPVPKRKGTSKRKNRTFKKHNDHLGDVLQDYSEKVK